MRIAQLVLRLWPESPWGLRLPLRMAGIDKNRWTLLSPLLDELLDADEPVRSVRLAHIRDTDGDLADDLSALLHRQAVIEKERFLEGSAARWRC